MNDDKNVLSTILINVVTCSTIVMQNLFLSDAGKDFLAECMLIGIDMSLLEYQLSLV